MSPFGFDLDLGAGAHSALVARDLEFLAISNQRDRPLRGRTSDRSGTNGPNGGSVWRIWTDCREQSEPSGPSFDIDFAWKFSSAVPVPGPLPYADIAMELPEIKPLHLSREWTRLLKSGGRDRKTKAPKAMKPKTVRNIAGLVSSAFARAIKWGLVSANPVTHSDLPKVRKRIGIALLPSEQDRLTEVATGPWCLSAFLEVTASSGARRGGVLALRWADLHGSTIVIDRSLCQTNEGLIFKGTKNEEPRKIELPPSTVACLEAHRLRQDQFRHQFGSDYQKDLDLIFTNPDGSPLMPNSISSTVSRLCRRLGLPKGASLHVLRHSHESRPILVGREYERLFISYAK